jgi:DNA-binding NarL/FixJ family response regulator
MEQRNPSLLPAKPRFSILIAGNNALARSGLRFLLRQRDDWAIVGFARSGDEVVDEARQLCPDLVIVDLDMPGLDGLEASSRILKTQPKTRLLIISKHASQESLGRALALGIDGYVLESDQERYFADAVEAIQRGNSFYTPSVSALLRKGLLPYPEQSSFLPGDHRLSRRERDIIRLVADGNSNKEVAALLDISVRTAENHRAHAMRKLGLRSVSQLVRHAVRVGLVAP